MLKTVGCMYITLMAPIVAGIMNSVWCKSSCLSKLKKPIDGGHNWKDGERILGDHKTWKGFAGYLLYNTICMILWGFVCKGTNLEDYNFFYRALENNVVNNLWIGLMLGGAYALAELPNSFLKRRLGIVPGKTISGYWKVFFIFFDQADSVFGCVLVVAICYPMSIGFYLVYVLLGAATHILINMLLYGMKLRKNMF